MNKLALWLVFIKAHPEWETEGAHFTANGLKKFFDTVWTEAQRDALHAFEEASNEAIVDFMKGMMK
jgi:hypothetical protein